EGREGGRRGRGRGAGRALGRVQRSNRRAGRGLTGRDLEAWGGPFGPPHASSHSYFFSSASEALGLAPVEGSSVRMRTQPHSSQRRTSSMAAARMGAMSAGG